jgi:hypothetical protein
MTFPLRIFYFEITHRHQICATRPVSDQGLLAGIPWMTIPWMTIGIWLTIADAGLAG